MPLTSRRSSAPRGRAACERLSRGRGTAALISLSGTRTGGALDAAHGAWLIGVLAVANAILGMALGLFVSAFARTEFQVVQFMPALIFPQLLLCGLFVSREAMADWLHAISWPMPLSYAYEALALATRSAPPQGAFLDDILAVVGFTLAALVLGALTLRRRTAWQAPPGSSPPSAPAKGHHARVIGASSCCQLASRRSRQEPAVMACRRWHLIGASGVPRARLITRSGDRANA